MKLVEDNYYNTGGGCMVMYVDVENDDKIKQFGCNDELVVGLSSRYGSEDDNDESLWYADNYEQLVSFVGGDIAKQLHERFLKHEKEAFWFPQTEK